MPGVVRSPQTLYDKVLAAHIVDEQPDGTLLLYIGELVAIACIGTRGTSFALRPMRGYGTWLGRMLSFLRGFPAQYGC